MMRSEGRNRWSGLVPGFYILEWLDDGTFIPRRLAGREIDEAKTHSFMYLGGHCTYTITGTCPENVCVYPELRTS